MLYYFHDKLDLRFLNFYSFRSLLEVHIFPERISLWESFDKLFATYATYIVYIATILVVNVILIFGKERYFKIIETLINGDIIHRVR